MTRLLTYLVVICSLSAGFSRATAQSADSVVQLYGVVMTADSLRALEGASIVVVGKGRGTIANGQGVFSIAVLKGDVIEFSFVGYRSKKVTIPRNLDESEYSVIQLMVSDDNYLPGTIIRPRPTRPQFERDFVNADIPADEYELARQNTDEQKRLALMRTLPSDGKEAANYTLRQTSGKTTYAGQVPPMNIMNPFAWQQFIKSWKRGDFKSKK